jgi:hypothetical protein
MAVTAFALPNPPSFLSRFHAHIIRQRTHSCEENIEESKHRRRKKKMLLMKRAEKDTRRRE